MKLILILTYLLIAQICNAQSLEQVKYFREAALKYKVPVNKLVKIAYIESRFKADAVRYNKNNTMDVGVMQINSIHWDTTCKVYDVTTIKGNIMCGAKILASHKWRATKDDCWVAVFHSKTPKFKQRYCNKLAEVPNHVIMAMEKK